MEFFRKKPKKDLNLSLEQIFGVVERRKERGIIEDQTYIISLSFRRARKKLKLSVAEMAALSGKAVEQIIDLEYNGLRLPEAVDLSGDLRSYYKIDKASYNNILLRQSAEGKI